MKIHEIIGYDRNGTVRELDTALNKATLNTRDVTFSALGFNAPGWIAASSMSILYSISGHQAPLAILIAYFFPMLVMAFCMIALTRQAPSAGGVFTFTSRFLHSNVGTVLGWAYAVACTAVMAMCAVIGSEYIQALIPALAGPLNAKLIGTAMVLTFLVISCNGVNATAKVASVFLIFEISVVAGLGLMGIIDPQVQDLSVTSMYSLEAAGGWSAIGPAVLFGVWMLANFDSAINYIEESRVPVRTVQRAMLLVLTSAFIIYSLAAIGWQFAVPVEQLAAIIEDGNGGPIAAVANVYLPPAMAWIALFVVITSACAGMQISSSAAARTLYRMSEEGHLPVALRSVNKSKSPWLASVIVSAVAIALLWWKPLDKIVWYYDVVTITLVMSYMAAIAAFIVMTWRRHGFGVSLALSIPASLAILVLGYIGYTAGANPVSPEDQYTAWYLGALTILSGVMILLWRSRTSRRTDLSQEQLQS